MTDTQEKQETGTETGKDSGPGQKLTAIHLDLVLSDKYQGKNILDLMTFSTDGMIEYMVSGGTMGTSGKVKVRCSLEHLVQTYGMPTNKKTLTSSANFKFASPEERLAAVKVGFVGIDPNSTDAADLLLGALYGGHSEIAEFLFSQGVQVFSVTGTAITLHHMDIRGTECTVFNTGVTSTGCRPALLRHILRTYREYPRTFFTLLLDDTCPVKRLQILAYMPDVPDDLVKEFAAFLHFLYLLNPDSVIKMPARDRRVREVLLTEFGVINDSEIHKTVYAHFVGVRVRLDKVDSVCRRISDLGLASQTPQETLNTPLIHP